MQDRLWGEHFDLDLSYNGKAHIYEELGPMQGTLSAEEVSALCSSGVVEVLAALVYEQFEVSYILCCA